MKQKISEKICINFYSAKRGSFYIEIKGESKGINAGYTVWQNSCGHGFQLMSEALKFIEKEYPDAYPIGLSCTQRSDIEIKAKEKD